jgi:hypothetical protein
MTCIWRLLEGILQKNNDAVCLSDMLSELLNEMGGRGFDTESASFTNNP